MAILGDPDRIRIWRGIMRYFSDQRDEMGLTKVQLRNAINATDQWIDDNAGAYNSALPAPARNNLTAAQKTLLFCLVASMRVSRAFTRRLVGEVN